MEPMAFKFRFVSESGHETGFMGSRGLLNENELVLGEMVLPLASIYQVVRRYGRLAITYAVDNGHASVVISPYRGFSRKLKTTIDRLCSYRWTQERHAQLAREGRDAAFRTARCPSCTAVIDLTGFTDTPQFYCVYCEKLQPSQQDTRHDFDAYSLCDRCGFYSQLVRLTATYIVLNFISWSQHYCCHNCMRTECWKMLGVNLLPPFIGMAPAIYQTVRAFSAGNLDKLFPELVKANGYARKGRADDAVRLYELMLQRVPVQAGLRLNMALAYARAGNWQHSLDAAEDALADCSNYQPAGNVVCQALTQLGRQEESTQYSQRWGMPSEHSQQGEAIVTEAIQRHGPPLKSERIQADSTR